jgi:GNAT superfamily N-acetyltransferase
MTVLRQACRRDIAEMHRVRLSVRQNRLTSRIVSEADYIAAIEETGRGWVVEHEGCVVGFAVGNSRSGNIWALFVDPDYEGHGYGRELHTAMTSWLWSRGLEWLWLTTEPGTRAERFYRQPAGLMRAVQNQVRSDWSFRDQSKGIGQRAQGASYERVPGGA